MASKFLPPSLKRKPNERIMSENAVLDEGTSGSSLMTKALYFFASAFAPSSSAANVSRSSRSQTGPRQPYMSVRPMPGTFRVISASEPLICPSSPRTAMASQSHMGFCLAQRLLCAKFPFGWRWINASYSGSVFSVISSYMTVHLQIHI